MALTFPPFLFSTKSCILLLISAALMIGSTSAAFKYYAVKLYRSFLKRLPSHQSCNTCKNTGIAASNPSTSSVSSSTVDTKNTAQSTKNSIHPSAAPIIRPKPVPPEAPHPEDCCGSGCSPCIFDIYYDQLEKYEKELAKWTAEFENLKAEE